MGNSYVGMYGCIYNLPAMTPSSYSCRKKIVFLLILPGEIRVRRVCKRLSVFSQSSMVSSCVRWLYCCNPPNPIVVSVPRVHTHTLTGSVPLSPEAQWKSSRSSHLEHTQRSHTGKDTCMHTSNHGRAAMPNTGRQFILSIYTCFADCKLHLSKHSLYFASFVLTLYTFTAQRTGLQAQCRPVDSQGRGFSWAGA